MSKNVILQAKDWRDWYRVRDWLNTNAPEGFTLRSYQDSLPAAFEYPARYQTALMQFLYPEAYPVTPESPAGFTQPPPPPTDGPGRSDPPAPNSPAAPAAAARNAPVERVAAIPAATPAAAPAEEAKTAPEPAVEAKRTKPPTNRPANGAPGRK